MRLNRLFTSFLAIGFAVAFGLISVQEASAQRYLTEIKDSNEANGIVQFAENLASFLELAEKIEAGDKSDAVYIRFENVAKKIKDGTSNFRSNVKGLAATFKNRNQWNDELDSQFTQLLSSRKIKTFFQRNGGRKILTDADAAISSIPSDVDTIVANIKKLRAANSDNSSVFMRTAFASNASARKLSFKCVALGIGIALAELKGMKRTAENLDGFFDKSCGAGANTAT